MQDQQHVDHRGKPRDFRGEHRPTPDLRGDLRAEIHGDMRGRRVQEVAEEDEKMPKVCIISFFFFVTSLAVNLFVTEFCAMGLVID